MAVKNSFIPGLGGSGGLPFTNGWTLDKLLKGAGAGLDPIEISGWQVITELVVPSDVSYVDLNSLDGNTDKFYLIFAAIRNPIASDYTLACFVNGDYTEANYYSQVIDADGATLLAARLNSPCFGGIPASGQLVVMAYVTRDPAGYYRFYTFSSRRVGSAVVIQNWACCKTATIANITVLRLLCGAAAIGQNSVILLCKPRTA